LRRQRQVPVRSLLIQGRQARRSSPRSAARR